MQFRNMKIGKRAAGIFILLGILVLLMGSLSLYETSRMDNASYDVRTGWMPAVVSLGDVSTNLGKTRILLLGSLLEAEDQARAPLLRELQVTNARLQDDIADYEKTVITPEGRTRFDAFNNAYRDYSHTQSRLIASLGNGDAQGTRTLTGELNHNADSMMTAMNALISFNSKGAYAATERTAEAATEAFKVTISALVVIVALLAAIAVLLTRSIVGPLAEAVAVAQRVATGDLTRDRKSVV